MYLARAPPAAVMKSVLFVLKEVSTPGDDPLSSISFFLAAVTAVASLSLASASVYLFKATLYECYFCTRSPVRSLTAFVEIVTLPYAV